MLTESFQPLFYSEIGYGPADQVGYKDSPEEFFGEQEIHI